MKEFYVNWKNKELRWRDEKAVSIQLDGAWRVVYDMWKAEPGGTDENPDGRNEEHLADFISYHWCRDQLGSCHFR